MGGDTSNTTVENPPFNNVGEYATWLAGQVGLSPANYPVSLKDIEGYVKFRNPIMIQQKIKNPSLACLNDQIYLTDPKADSAFTATLKKRD